MDSETDDERLAEFYAEREAMREAQPKRTRFRLSSEYQIRLVQKYWSRHCAVRKIDPSRLESCNASTIDCFLHWLVVRKKIGTKKLNKMNTLHSYFKLLRMHYEQLYGKKFPKDVADEVVKVRS